MKGQRFRIKGSSKYLADKYGTPNPIITIEDTDQGVFGGSWMHQQGNPACLMYAMRSAFDNLPFGGTVYYGKISGLGELVHESELEAAAVVESPVHVAQQPHAVRAESAHAETGTSA